MALSCKWNTALILVWYGQSLGLEKPPVAKLRKRLWGEHLDSVYVQDDGRTQGKWKGAGNTCYISEWKKYKVSPQGLPCMGWVIIWINLQRDDKCAVHCDRISHKEYFAPVFTWQQLKVILYFILQRKKNDNSMALLCFLWLAMLWHYQREGFIISFYISACNIILTSLSKIQTHFPLKGYTYKSVCRTKLTRKY